MAAEGSRRARNRQRAATIPGWVAELDKLEEGFTVAWRAGNDPREELAGHEGWWRAGLSGHEDGIDTADTNTEQVEQSGEA